MPDVARFVAPTDSAELARPDAAPKPLAVEFATRLVLGVTDVETLAWVRSGLLRWLKSDGTASLSASLHLGDSPRRFRLAVRDGWLRSAAEYLSGTPWQRAAALQIEVEHFTAYKWPAWRRHDEAPASATPVEHALFIACLADANLPQTTRRLYAILTEADR